MLLLITGGNYIWQVSVNGISEGLIWHDNFHLGPVEICTERSPVFSTALNVFAEKLRQSLSFAPWFVFPSEGERAFTVIHGGYCTKEKNISSEKTNTIVETTVKFDNLLIYLSKGLQFHFKAGEGILTEPRKWIYLHRTEITKKGERNRHKTVSTCQLLLRD